MWGFMRKKKPPKPPPTEELLGIIVLELRAIAIDVKEIVELLKLIVQPHIAQSATLTIGGESMLALDVGKTATALLREWSGPGGTGTEVKPIGPVSYTSDDPTVATVDGVSGVVTAVAPSKLDAGGNPVPVNISGVDAGNGLN